MTCFTNMAGDLHFCRFPPSTVKRVTGQAQSMNLLTSFLSRARVEQCNKQVAPSFVLPVSIHTEEQKEAESHQVGFPDQVMETARSWELSLQQIESRTLLSSSPDHILMQSEAVFVLCAASGFTCMHTCATVNCNDRVAGSHFHTSSFTIYLCIFLNCHL